MLERRAQPFQGPCLVIDLIITTKISSRTVAILRAALLTSSRFSSNYPEIKKIVVSHRKPACKCSSSMGLPASLMRMIVKGHSAAPLTLQMRATGPSTSRSSSSRRRKRRLLMTSSVRSARRRILYWTESVKRLRVGRSPADSSKHWCRVVRSRRYLHRVVGVPHRCRLAWRSRRQCSRKC